VTRRQHHRGKKRLKGWHRGRGEARRWARSVLPDVQSGADPTTGQLHINQHQPPQDTA
jgi:hypothetical protein